MSGNLFSSQERGQEVGSRGVDTHAHIDLLQENKDVYSIVQNAKQAGIEKIGQVFLNISSYERNKYLSEDYPGLFFYLLGFHPHEASGFTRDSPGEMQGIIRSDSRIKACGEIGLDFYRNRSPQKEQIDCFKSQLELARQQDWPVVIHSREADDTTLEILLDMGFKDRALLWHCYGRELEFGERLISYGWKISIPGTVTFKKARELQNAVHKLPLESMVLETDCPFLTPEPFRGKKNEPAFVNYTAKKVAELKGIPLQEVWEQTTENACAFFGI